MQNKSKTTKQSKPNEPQPQPQPAIPRIPSSSFQYLRRTLHLDQDDGGSLIKLNVKRIHVKKLLQKDRSGSIQKLEQLRRTHRKCLKKSFFKALTTAHFKSLHDFYWIEDLKNSKKLLRFTYPLHLDCPLEIITIYMKRISKNLEEIDLHEGSHPFNHQLFQTIEKFYRLKSCSVLPRRHRLGENEELVKQEFQYFKRYLSRSKSLRDLCCYLPCSGRVSLPNILKEGAVYSQVTSLEMPLYCLRSFSHLKQGFIHAQQDENDRITSSVLPSLKKVFKGDSQQSAPFFPFQVFSNLKEFDLRVIEWGPAYLPTFFPFVAKGFHKLCSLEKLHLNLKSRAPQVEQIFKGMLDLPQLSSFSLVIDFPNSLHWNLLTKFLTKQTNLISFRFEISELLKKESEFLEEFLATLSQKPKLQYLNLKANYWPLSSLSRGFKRIVNSTNIKSFIFRIGGSGFSMPIGFQYPFQGLCEFLLRNKETLNELRLELPLLKEQEFHEELSKGISQLTKLKDLWIGFSVGSLVDSQASHVFEAINVVNSEVFRDPKKQWNPRIDLMLKPLKELENLTFDFTGMHSCEPNSRKWMSNSFKTLLKLKSLRRFEFVTPERLSKAEAKTLIDTLEKLKNISYLGFLNFYGDNDLNSLKVLDKMVKVRAQQDLCVSLSF